MTSQVAKCERIFSNGESSVGLEIDYQNKRYALSWGLKLFLWKTIDCVKDDYALLDLIRQAIEFAEKELTEEGPKDKKPVCLPDARECYDRGFNEGFNAGWKAGRGTNEQ